jgi:hypothetical protein
METKQFVFLSGKTEQLLMLMLLTQYKHKTTLGCDKLSAVSRRKQQTHQLTVIFVCEIFKRLNNKGGFWDLSTNNY